MARIALLLTGLLFGLSARLTGEVPGSGDAATTGDTWRTIETTPVGFAPREDHTTVWTGEEMIIWGGQTSDNLRLNDGSRFDVASSAWKPLSSVGAPSARDFHQAVWTGTEMIVWGGAVPSVNTGGRYNPVVDTWTATSTLGAPAPRRGHSAIWTGNEMIVWGGVGNTGGRYNPATDTWTPTNVAGAPPPRAQHTAVWTGSEMIIWGGTHELVPVNDGGRYDPASDTWASVPISGAPSARYWHTAVWTGNEMIIWGGFYAIIGSAQTLRTGGRYNPVSNTWIAPTLTGAPTHRHSHTAVWTGKEMIIWGGDTPNNTGGRYTPTTDAWTAMTTSGAPSARALHTAVWTGEEMIIWGGSLWGAGLGPDDTRAYAYTPDTGSFRITNVVRHGENLIIRFATVTNCTYTLWSSDTLAQGVWTNTGLPPVPGTGAIHSFSVSATTPLSRFFRVQASP